MIGKLFALTYESAAEKIKDMDKMCVMAKYRGQASKDFQDDFYGGMKIGTVAEGESFFAKVTGTANELLDNLLGGLRSGLTYGGARTIKELQRKAEFVEVSSTYQQESSVRSN
jgi:IMP dehydrogenase